MVTQSWHTQLANDRERQSSSAAGSADEERKQEFLESIAGPKGSESPDPQSETPIVVAGDEDDPAPPEQPLDERDTKIPRPIVSVNGKDVEKPEEKEAGGVVSDFCLFPPLPKNGRDGAPSNTNLTQSIQDKGCDSVPVLLIVVPHENLSKPTILRAAGS